jgi:hypothetical protein
VSIFISHQSVCVATIAKDTIKQLNQRIEFLTEEIEHVEENPCRYAIPGDLVRIHIKIEQVRAAIRSLEVITQ